MQKQIQDYQDKIEKLIKAGSQSNAILTRWLNRVSTLEDKKYDYEVILKQRLNDMVQSLNVSERFAMSINFV